MHFGGPPILQRPHKCELATSPKRRAGPTRQLTSTAKHDRTTTTKAGRTADPPNAHRQDGCQMAEGAQAPKAAMVINAWNLEIPSIEATS